MPKGTPKTPTPDPEGLLAAIRSATGIHASDEPDLVAAVRSIASQMDRHRRERDEMRISRDAYAEQRDEARAQLRDQGENLAAITRDRDALRGEVAALKQAVAAGNGTEAKLSDIRAILRVDALGLLTDTRPEDAIQSILDRP